MGFIIGEPIQGSFRVCKGLPADEAIRQNDPAVWKSILTEHVPGQVTLSYASCSTNRGAGGGGGG